ncbi:MAG TPA: hypothetical protein VMC43_02365 [Candidatus Paceibacterota bacterium]|nr:hypothetical protein [Candidatus Paceibacterota bacterium]
MEKFWVVINAVIVAVLLREAWAWGNPGPAIAAFCVVAMVALGYASVREEKPAPRPPMRRTGQPASKPLVRGYQPRKS